ncbi:hypothetical protein DBR11_07905 [Pedobacter sp. HMWF019]|nr:hypothetical protein DBR11_07905 [Pedobacter sp. HMWF019]
MILWYSGNNHESVLKYRVIYLVTRIKVERIFNNAIDCNYFFIILFSGTHRCHYKITGAGVYSATSFYNDIRKRKKPCLKPNMNHNYQLLYLNRHFQLPGIEKIIHLQKLTKSY